MFVKGEVRALPMGIWLDDDVVANPVMGIGMAGPGSCLIDADGGIRVEIAVALIGEAEPGMNESRVAGQSGRREPVLVGDADIVGRTQVAAELLIPGIVDR